MIGLSDFDFVDFGCSTGGSIDFAKKKLGGLRGVGIDIDPKKVESTRSRGVDAILADATDKDQFDGKVRFSILSHFLEHLPSQTIVTKALNTAVHVSRRFVFVRQPWFDSDGDLLAQGLKFYWSDWSGHSMPLTSLQMYVPLAAMLSRGTIARFGLFGYKRISHSSDSRLIPLGGPVNASHYDSALHGPKAEFDLRDNVYAELVTIIARSDGTMLDKVLSKFTDMHKLYDSDDAMMPA
jgi:SAM-dependent methyltransferase